MPTNFFKILGSENPVNTSLGVMTQGLGFPLRDVEPSISGGDVTVVVESALTSASIIDQLPVGLGTALQVVFGDAQTTTWFDIDALGNITCLVADEYTLRVKFAVGRRGAPSGLSQIYTRALINGVAQGPSSHAILDNPDVEIPFDYEGVGTLAVNDILTFEIIRDTDGDNSGGLYAGNPTVVGWADSPSANLTLSRFVAVTP
jgi:hypothetical protein